MKNALIITAILMTLSLGSARIPMSYASYPTPTMMTTAMVTVYPSATNQIQNVQTTEIKGEVLGKQGQVLTIATDNGNTTKQVTIPQNITITRNTVGATMNDIQPHDIVTLRQSNGQVLSLDATAGSVFDFGKWALPILILAILAGLIIWFLMKRANKSHIKTTVA